MKKTIAINGFGRIGRAFLRAILLDEKARSTLNVAAINIGPSLPSNLDLLFKYDSIMGQFPGEVTFNNNKLTVNGHQIDIFMETDPEKIEWRHLNIDWVVEASGLFTKANLARKHLAAGCKKVVITAPAKDEDVTIIPGVNDDAYKPKIHQIVSLGSCTTNCFAPVVKVLHETFEVNSGLMTTIHSYTNDQVLLDVEHHDPRRARAAAINIIPTKTGASKVVTKLFPKLEGKIDARAVRVPVPIVSLIDFSFSTKKPFNVEKINETFKQAALGPMKGIIQYVDKPLVSSDFIGNQASCIFDSLLTQSTENIGKVFAWYDNEFGYSCRLKDFLLHNE